MKRLDDLKLTKRSKALLEAQQMNVLWGGGPGDNCGCACAYANSGGSNVAVNMAANSQTGSQSPSDNTYWISYKCYYYWENSTTFHFSGDFFSFPF